MTEPASATALPRKNALAFIAITILLDTIGFGLIIPVLPRLLVELTGQNLSTAAKYGGWLSFVYATMQFLSAPTLGNLSDRFGRRPVLLYAIGALGIDYMVMGFAPTLGWLFLGRAIAGMAGASFTPAYAYIADVTTMENRAKSFGMVGTMFGVGFIAGPAIGGFLATFGPRAPFFAAAALSFANLLYGLIFLSESLPRERRRAMDWKRANPLGILLHLRRHRAVLGMLAALFLWMLANQVMPTTWGFYTKLRFNWSESMIGASLATAGLMMALSQTMVLPRLVAWIGERRAALTGMAVGAIGYFGFAMATANWMLFAWLSAWLVAAIVMATTNAQMSHRVSADAQGELQGAVASLNSLSSMIGPPIMAHLFAIFSAPSAPVHLPGAAFIAASLFVAISFVIFWAATAEDIPDEHPAHHTEPLDFVLGALHEEKPAIATGE